MKLYIRKLSMLSIIYDNEWMVVEITGLHQIAATKEFFDVQYLLRDIVSI